MTVKAISRRILPLAASAVAAGALARPARACDPEALDAHLSAVCDAALSPARAALSAVLPHATAEEKAQAEAALARATDACNTGDPAEGARLAAGLARLAGHIEGRAGLAPPLAAIG